MHRLPFVIKYGVLLLLVLLWQAGATQSPHGKDFQSDCAMCHTDKNWVVQPEHIQFDHDTTGFALKGGHTTVQCITCHPTLVFDEALAKCNSCHKDVHDGTVGNNCSECHTSGSWLMDNAIEQHEEWGFVLQGPHSRARCNQCHKQETEGRFPPIGQECVDCHQSEYLATTQPNHLLAGFTMDCARCHLDRAEQWMPLDHSFFPLTGVHAIAECNRCHDGTNYTNISSDCVYCHLDDFDQTTNPSHPGSGFSMQCEECHTLSPGWKVDQFRRHDDAYFPIFSGKHRGEWNACVDCHTDPKDYRLFSCLNCHEHRQSKMDDEHDEVKGYIYESNACLQCHPDGDK